MWKIKLNTSFWSSVLSHPGFRPGSRACDKEQGMGKSDRNWGKDITRVCFQMAKLGADPTEELCGLHFRIVLWRNWKPEPSSTASLSRWEGSLRGALTLFHLQTRRARERQDRFPRAYDATRHTAQHRLVLPASASLQDARLGQREATRDSSLTPGLHLRQLALEK